MNSIAPAPRGTWLFCYTQALLTQMVQTAACNRHHSVDLLRSLDRVSGNELFMSIR